MSEDGQGAASHARQAEGAALPPDGAVQLDVSTAVSHTNLNQVSSGVVCPASEGKWRCETCTYDNYPQSKKCTMCRAPKPVLGEDIFSLQDGASALPAPPPATPPATPPASPPASPPAVTSPAPDVLTGDEGVADRLKPLRISSPPGGPGPASSDCAPNKWPCPTCTYENWPKSLKCAMCGAPPPTLSKPQLGASEACGAAAGGSPRRSKRPAPAADWIWLQACLGVVEGCPRRVEAYLACGGDPARALTAAEVALLDRASAFDAGHTLVHLAIRFQRQEILTTLLSRISGGGSGLKRSPSYIAPDLAAAIRRQLATAVRYKKGGFPCRYVTEFNTFTLPSGIEALPSAVRAQLVSELVDREAQAACERAGGARLYALWNRSAGDCLPDAVCQAALGVSDRDNALRGALHETLVQAARALFPRWAAWERAQAARLGYAPDDGQLRAEWARLVRAAAQPGAPLRQLHVWVLAHVMRRPLLVYGEDLVRSFRGEPLGYARFQGIYLPLLWEPAFCSKSPLCLGYTRGHFSALVAMDQQHYICRERQDESRDVAILPLTDADGKLLPVHFLDCEDEAAAREVRRWVRAAGAGAGAACVQAAPPRPLRTAQMLEEWLNHYRRGAELSQQQTRGPFPPRLATTASDYCSDPDTDEE